MRVLRILSAAEQVTDHLRNEILNRTWGESMPGAASLARQLGVGRNTIDVAFRVLEEEGILLPEGAGRRRRIVIPEHVGARPLQVRFLAHNDEDRRGSIPWLEPLHYIQAGGHSVEFADDSVTGVSRNLSRLKRLVNKTPADAWVVGSGSHEVLSWFVENRIPVFALGGRMRGKPIAGVKPDKLGAQTVAIRRLVELGHRRIVRMVLEERMTPMPGFIEREFLKELEAHGIPTGPYNHPTWDGSLKGFFARLDALFRLTPPTAMFFDMPNLFVSAQHYLARRGILAPEHVSLICGDPDASFLCLDPYPSHIEWTFSDMARRMVRWLDNIAAGKEDIRQTFTKARFIEGGTIGPVPGVPQDGKPNGRGT